MFFSLKSISRQLSGNKLYASINVFGLSVSIVCILLAVLYWNDERSFDNFHRSNPHLYRVTTSFADRKTGEIIRHMGTGQVQGPAFKNAVPEIQDYVRLMGGNIFGDVIANNKSLRVNMLFSDESFFRIFTFHLLKGNPITALSNVNSVVVTETIARKYFNSIDVIGKQLKLNADPSADRLGKPMTITGVMRDPPANSSIKFDILLPMTFMQLSFTDTNWQNSYLGTYIVLHPDAHLKKVLKKFQEVYAIHGHQQLQESIKTYKYDPKITYGLQRMTDIHLYSQSANPSNSELGAINESKPLYSYLFMGIAVFILLMSCINFVNISIASSLKRAKEVGIRKITGGSRSQIILQFLSESSVLCLISLVVSVLLMQSALPLFNTLTNKQIAYTDVLKGKVLISLFLIFVFIILLTGFYPSYTLSRFTPTEVLYNKLVVSGKNIFRKSLIVFQISLAVFLMIATLVYYIQMRYVEEKDLGYNPDLILQTYIGGPAALQPIVKLMKRQAVAEPSIKMISFGGGENTYDVKLVDKTIDAVNQVIDENYLPMMEIPLLIGRNLDPVQFRLDSIQSAIVNEAFVKASGLKDPIGVQIKTDEYFDNQPKRIIGVVKDFHVSSLREPIKPLVMFMNNWYGGSVYVKLSNASLTKGMESFEKIYKNALPGAVYTYDFVDEKNAGRYAEEQRWQKIITAAALLSILICCLGLFGMVHIATQQRMKEIGIRKVLGATAGQIFLLISGNFLKLVGIAFMLGAPLAWVVMHKWLQDFAYRVNFGPGIFIVAAFASTCMALIAISMQSVKAANANPVETLRS
jgi:putative ABC transport system permease protein